MATVTKGITFSDTDPTGRVVNASRLNDHVDNATVTNIAAADLADALRKDTHLYAAGTFSGSGDSGVYAVTLSPAVTSYTAGMVVRFKASARNEGNTNINVNAVGAVDLLHADIELANGEIAADQVVVAVYDGAAFQVVSGPLRVFESSEADLSQGQISAAHGLVVTPRIVRAVLRCYTTVTAEAAGYVVDDEVDASAVLRSVTTNSFQQPNITVGANATSVWASVVSVGGAGETLWITNKAPSTDVISVWKPTNWKIRLIAQV